MANSLISKLSRQELDCIRQVTKTVFDYVHFYVYKTGPCCNAMKSVSVLDAECDLQCIRACDVGADRVSTWGANKPVQVEFRVIYKKGFDILRKLFSDSVTDEDFDEPSLEAFEILINFIKDLGTSNGYFEKFNGPLQPKDLTEKNLKKEDEIAVIAEHFLRPLCPKGSFSIHSRNIGSKIMCKCGCNAAINTGGTGIGNEHVWHGFIDIIFESHGGILNGASVAKRENIIMKRYMDEDEDISEEENMLDENLSDDDDFVSEAQQKKINVAAKIKFQNQATAQAIVFSILQKNRHPDLDNFLIPFIAIFDRHIQILMYDSDNDILLCSEELPVFNDVDDTYPILVTMVTLWMALHYKYFCSGIDLGNLGFSLDHIKSGFTNHIEAVWEHYELLSSRVSSFPNVDTCNLIGSSKDELYTSASVFNALLDTFH